MESIITFDYVTLAYNYRPIIVNFSTQIPEGVFAGIIGPNGAGKSTLLKALLGFVKPVAGKIRIKSGTKIAYVPQRFGIDWSFPITVFEVVLMGTYGSLGWFERPSTKEYEQVNKALELVGLTQYAHQLIGQLSGGQQQRMFLARAFVQKGDLYILDEPFTGLDMFSQEIMITVLRQLVKEGKTVLMVHHDLHAIKEYFNWLMILNQQTGIAGALESIQVQQALLELSRNL